jgi:hypothetical protein
MKTRLSIVLTIALLCSGLAAPGVAASPLMSGLGHMSATSFTPVGAGPISGWWWMRSAAYSDSGIWRFVAFDRDVIKPGKPLHIVLTPLVTQAAGGGSGWIARIKVKVTLTCGTSTSTMVNTKIMTKNPFPLRTTADSAGVGYQNYAYLTVARSKFKCDNGLLKVIVTRDPTYKSHGFRPHVAINSDAAQLYWYTP